MALLFDATMLLMRQNHGAMTGIDRVEFAVAALLADEAGQDSHEHAFVVDAGPLTGLIPAARMSRWLAEMRTRRGGDLAPTPLFAQLQDILSEPPRSEPGKAGATRLSSPQAEIERKNASMAVLREALAGSLAFTRHLRAARDTLGYLQASHLRLHQPRRHRWIARLSADATFFVHDLIPIKFPQFCSASAHASHKAKMERVAQMATRIAVNSRATAQELRDYLDEQGLPVRPIAVHRLATGALPGYAALPSSNSPRPAHPYFLCSGTLEGRKNVGLLLETWRRLAGAVDTAAMPRLVLAGGRGWSNSELLRDLDTLRDIAPFVVEANGLNDVEIALLTQGARAVLTPSHAEGYSLVPAEALAMGVPAIVSDIPAHRELAGAVIVAVQDDPVDAWLAHVLSPPERPAAPVPTRGWEEFARQLTRYADTSSMTV